MSAAPIQVLRDFARARLSDDAKKWLDAACEKAAHMGVDRSFFIAFGTMSRRVGREPLALGDDERRIAAEARSDFDPSSWTTEDLGRTLLVLSLPSEDAGAYVRTLDRLFADADLREQVQLYRTLPLLPHPEAHRARCAEGIRTNMTDVFEAVALDNPYPAEQLDELAMNQLVLKAIFLGSPLHRVVGIDQRANPKLARMLVDFAKERRSAGRKVPPQLWRTVGPFATGDLEAEIANALRSDDERERLGAALSLAQTEAGATLAKEHPAPFEAVALAGTDWATLYEEPS